ncbi:hypothetical protein D3C79_737820 [compost metagenome]
MGQGWRPLCIGNGDCSQAAFKKQCIEQCFVFGHQVESDQVVTRQLVFLLLIELVAQYMSRHTHAGGQLFYVAILHETGAGTAVVGV